MQYLLGFGCGERVMRTISARPDPAVVRVGQDGSPAPRAAERGAVGAELGRVAAAGALAPELLVPAQLLPPQRGRLQGVHVGEGDALALPDVPLRPDCGMEWIIWPKDDITSSQT